jgi:hypothetical protein
VQVQALEAAVAKDRKQLTNSLTAATATGKKKMQEKFQAMQEMSNKFQQVNGVRWCHHHGMYAVFVIIKNAQSLLTDAL